MSWAVVIFVDDDSVEVVPSTWCVGKECFWPSLKGAKLKEAIIKQSTPQDTWTKYKIRLLKCYDDFKVASKKCELAKEQESLSSCSETISLSQSTAVSFGKGCRKLTPKNLPEYEYLRSNSETDDEEEANAVIKFPRSPFPVRSTNKHDEQSHRLEKTGNHYCPKLDAMHKYESEEVIVDNGVEVVKTLFPVCHKNKEDEHTIQLKNVTTNRDNEIMYEVTRLSEKMDFMLEKNKEFQKQCIRNFSLIGNRLKELNENLEILMNRPQMNIHEGNEPDDEFLQLVQSFPIENECQLNKIEIHLKDSNIMSKLAKEFSRVGGDTVKQITRAIMYRIVTNELGLLYSFEGFKKKKIFKNLEIYKLVLRAVRLNKDTSEATEKEIIVQIKSWLAQAKFRLKGNANTPITTSAAEDNSKIISLENS